MNDKQMLNAYYQLIKAHKQRGEGLRANDLTALVNRFFPAYRVETLKVNNPEKWEEQKKTGPTGKVWAHPMNRKADQPEKPFPDNLDDIPVKVAAEQSGTSPANQPQDGQDLTQIDEQKEAQGSREAKAEKPTTKGRGRTKKTESKKADK